jgi:RimJ/RimL family protein N-acetyltransferase
MKLEKFDETDEDLYSRLVFNEETMKMNLGRVFTEEEAQMFFRAVLEMNATESCLGYYKVLISREGKITYIGMGAINYNEEYEAVEIEYMLLPEYWNQGYGTELVEILIKMVSDARVSSSIIAISDPANSYSQRILVKKGFEFVKRYLNSDGELADLYCREV